MINKRILGKIKQIEIIYKKFQGKDYTMCKIDILACNVNQTNHI